MKRTVLFLVLLSLWGVAPAAAAEKAPPAPSAKDKCAVCGMFVAPYPNWLGAIVYKDGGRFFFDGPKDLFTYYLAPEKYGSARKPADIAEIYVKDYYSVTAIDGRKAFYVIGSDVRGPMGKELVPFAKKADADGFLKDHHGRKVLSFDEITRATLNSLE
jgi:nitrous oxide reductase accessory protein NosL